MPSWSHAMAMGLRSGWVRRLVWPALRRRSPHTAACGAELLSSYFPAGVPGYGTAPGVTVASRERPEFDPPGVRVGSFLLHPQCGAGTGLRRQCARQQRCVHAGAGSIGTHPSLLVSSDWSRNSLAGYVGVDDLRYLDQPRQSETNWTAALGGALSVGRDQLTVSVAHFGLHQPRTELDALPSDEPVAYQVDDVRAGYTIALNRFSVMPSLAFSTYRYDRDDDPWVPASQAYRDRNVLQGRDHSLRAVAASQSPAGDARAGQNYVAPQPGQPTRDSTGYQVLVGFSDDADAVWRYRVLVGWEMRAFRASQYGTHQAPIAEAALIWSPSGMTTLTATLTRSIEDAAQESIAGYTYHQRAAGDGS